MLCLGALPASAAQPASTSAVPDAPPAANAPSQPATTLTVAQESEGIVTVAAPDKSALPPDAQVLIVRRQGRRYESIATGKVAAFQRGQILIQLDKSGLTKLPQPGDGVVLMNAPLNPDVNDKKESIDNLIAKPKPPPARPAEKGYIQGGIGLLQADMTSTSSTQANSAKNAPSYRFKFLQGAYYSDFIPLGIEFFSVSGDFPTSTYYQVNTTSSQSNSVLSLNYRFRPVKRHWRFWARILSASWDFKTNNTDEFLLSTQASGLGVGGRVAYEWAPELWTPARPAWYSENDLVKEPLFGVTLQRVFFEAGYFPSLSVKDNGVSRGANSNGSSALDLKLGATAMLYWSEIPLLKRWVFELGYHYRMQNLKFSGTTVSEAGGIYTIPQSGTGTETEKFLSAFIGVRFEDPLSDIFSKKGKSE